MAGRKKKGRKPPRKVRKAPRPRNVQAECVARCARKFNDCQERAARDLERATQRCLRHASQVDRVKCVFAAAGLYKAAMEACNQQYQLGMSHCRNLG